MRLKIGLTVALTLKKIVLINILKRAPILQNIICIFLSTHLIFIYLYSKNCTTGPNNSPAFKKGVHLTRVGHSQPKNSLYRVVLN